MNTKISLKRLQFYFGDDDQETILGYFLPILNGEFQVKKSIQEILNSTEGFKENEEEYE